MKMDKFSLLVLASGMFTLGMIIQKYITFGLDAFITIYK